ncbi:MAG: hypothetical protein ACOX21_08700 [Bacillota bacterium]|jgi:uncharacterized membrane protein|nr:hypothetical protein [Bacillota bacterium]HPZ22053.1 hypothetical protein [Bacillota bacterium]HQD20465.1 hypothetical protein [Bacillota bacterium]
MGRRGGGGGRSFGGGGGRSFGGRSGGGFSRGGSRLGSFGRSSRSSGSSASGRSGGSIFGGGSSAGRSSGSTFRTGGIFRSPHRPSTVGSAWRPSYRPSFGGGGCGCLTPQFIILIAVIIILVFVFSSFQGCQGQPDSGHITPSTIKREPLPKGSVVETGYYTDNLYWIRNKTALTSGMRNFYKETGVQPYLYITGDINGETYPSESEVNDFAFALYDDLFSDEAHLLVIFFEPPMGDYYSTWYVVGTQAKAVLDDEAMDILLDYIDKYYYYDHLSNEEFFSKAFNDAGKRIMHVPKSPWIPTLIVIGIAIIIIIGFTWWRKAAEQKKREAEATERILSTPLETFGDSQAEELAKKYEDDPDKPN